MSARAEHILVTGVAGFLGSNFLAKLLAEGHRVTGVDNLSMGRRDNIDEFLGNAAFDFVDGDVTDPAVIRSIGVEVDCVVHLAAFKIPRYGKALDTLTINYEGTKNVLELARDLDCKCVLASTSDVYGRNPEVPFSEENSDSVIGSSKVARWSYAVSKLFDEHLAFAYQDAYEFPVTVLRFFGSYGPKQHLSWWGGPQSVFIDAVLNNRPIPIHGDGSQTRSFTYVSDTVAGIYAAMVKPEANNDIFNIGSNAEMTILELAEMIKRLSDTPGELEIEYVPYESFTGKKYQDVLRRVPDTTHCEQVLGVRAKVDVEEGLTRTIAWQRAATSALAS